MKKRHLLYLATTLTLIIAGVLLIPNQKNNYHPRNSNYSVASYHGAAEYYKMMKANPETGEFDGQLYIAIKESAQALNADKGGSALNIAWDEVGPDNIGGRTRSILIVNDELMFAGSVSGGLFKSANKGNTWERVAGFNINYAVSTMAVLGNGHIYVGTGNSHEFPDGNAGAGNNFVGPGSMGGGLFVSTDDGVTWNYAQDGGNDIKPTSLSGNAEYASFDKIVADPNNANKLWVGYNQALKPYTDGQGFGAVPSGLPAAACEDVDVSSDGNVIVASVGTSDGYVSNDGGATFNLISGSDEGQLQDSLNRLEFSISPDDENYVYAAVVNNTGKFDGVYSSIDKGNTWSKVWIVGPNSDADPFFQGYYNLAISVVPGNKDSYLLGALAVWSAGIQSTPEQRSLGFWQFFSPGSDISDITPPGQDVNGYTVAVHSDIHVFEWDANGTLFTGTDGGVYRSEDLANTFLHINRFYSVTQFYAVGYSADDKVIGGAQDNGTLYMTKDRSTLEEAISVGGGGVIFTDGFDCEVSNIEPTGDIAFATAPFGLFFRGSLSAQTGGPFGSPEMQNIFGPFHSQIRLWESKSQDTPFTVNYRNETGDPLPAGTEIFYSSNTLSVPLTAILDNDLAVDSTVALPDPVTSLFASGYTGSDGVWVTRDALNLNVNDNWAQVIDSVSGEVTAMEWSKNNGNQLYVGTSTGVIYRISGFANAYEVAEMSVDSSQYALFVNTIYTSPDNAPILGLSVSPSNPNILVAARGGFGGSAKVIKSTNAASANTTFSDIWFTSGNLVGLPAYTVVIEQDDPNVIFAGTEFGIYSTSDNGANWDFEGEDPIGAFPIFDLRQQWRSPNDVQNAGYIYVGSHGRGAFKSSAFSKHGVDDVVEPESNELVSNLIIAPNPMTTYGRLEFTSESEGLIYMDIYSIAGQRVKRLQFAMNKGVNNYRFDVSDLNHGTYIIQLNKDNKVTTKKFVIL